MRGKFGGCGDAQELRRPEREVRPAPARADDDGIAIGQRLDRVSDQIIR
jgi:hypothetical protein